MEWQPENSELHLGKTRKKMYGFFKWWNQNEWIYKSMVYGWNTFFVCFFISGSGCLTPPPLSGSTTKQNTFLFSYMAYANKTGLIKLLSIQLFGYGNHATCHVINSCQKLPFFSLDNLNLINLHMFLCLERNLKFANANFLHLSYIAWKTGTVESKEQKIMI